MPIRIGIFKAATAIYQQTGISLLKYSGTNVIPLEQSFGGEVGAFYFVPIIASLFDFSSQVASWYFFTGLIISGVIIAGSALLVQAKTFLGKSIAVLGISVLGTVAYFVGDVYIAYFFAIALFPWVVVLLERKWYKILVDYCFAAGILLQVAHFVRSYAALPVIFAISVVCAVFFKKKKEKIFFPLVALLLGMLVVQCHIQKVIDTRNLYLKEKEIVFEKDPIEHTFWHNIYMGFGFISNDKGLEFSDSCSSKKGRQINPNAPYLTDGYEINLRNEVLCLIFKSPNYALRVLFAKLGVLFYYFLLFCNVGLLAAYYYPKPLYLEVSYWLLILISALPGILTIPISMYLLGFMSACALYGIQSIVYALNKRSGFM